MITSYSETGLSTGLTYRYTSESSGCYPPSKSAFLAQPSWPSIKFPLIPLPFQMVPSFLFKLSLSDYSERIRLSRSTFYEEQGGYDPRYHTNPKMACFRFNGVNCMAAWSCLRFCPVQRGIRFSGIRDSEV